MVTTAGEWKECTKLLSAHGCGWPVYSSHLVMESGAVGQILELHTENREWQYGYTACVKKMTKDKLCHFKLAKVETWTKGVSVLHLSHNLQSHRLKKKLSLPGSFFRRCQAVSFPALKKPPPWTCSIKLPGTLIFVGAKILPVKNSERHLYIRYLE